MASSISHIILTILTTAGIPTAITGFAIWYLKKQIDRGEQKKEEKEKKRENLELLILDSVSAAVELSEATARAVQRIPDAHCNGDMHAALKNADEVKKKKRRFFEKEGLQNIL